jgi:hypothetical protein
VHASGLVLAQEHDRGWLANLLPTSGRFTVRAVRTIRQLCHASSVCVSAGQYTPVLLCGALVILRAKASGHIKRGLEGNTFV